MICCVAATMQCFIRRFVVVQRPFFMPMLGLCFTFLAHSHTVGLFCCGNDFVKQTLEIT